MLKFIARNFILLLLLLLTSKVSWADVTNDKSTEKIPAVWVWKVSNENRTIYLLGEMHHFLDVQENDVDFNLGYYIYDLSSKVYIETVFNSKSSLLPKEKLSNLLSENTVKRFKNLYSAFAFAIKIPPEKIAKYPDVPLKVLDSMSVANADIAIREMAGMLHFSPLRKAPTSIIGLSRRIEGIENIKSASNKIIYLERNNIHEIVWRDNCNTKELTEKLIDAALSTFNSDLYYRPDKMNIFQEKFKQNDESSGDMNTLFSELYPGGDLILRCNAIPRTALWMKDIFNLLETLGPTVSINVGLAHIVGSGGILEYLQKNKTYKIRRIYTIADLEH